MSMKYLLLSDVHSNYPALDEVLSDASGYDEILYLGDIIGIYGYPVEVVNTLQSKVQHAIIGNHDYAVIDRKEGHVSDRDISKYEYDYTWKQLNQSHVSWIKSLSSYKEINENTIIAHAQPYPAESTGYETGNKGVFKRNWTSVAANVPNNINFVFLGHTHEQGELNCERFGHNVHIVNPGSVGQPMGEANYAIIDTETNEASLHTVSYDTSELKEHLSNVVPKKWW